ncbi:four-helix bundle copper-binding protein [Faunimonas sp. B44]|uniref:four-helix bundle copper-binding protein n=1 Tax=Faunimonas sp. B44 TaxID=3461493 RepID=UPI004044D252
MHAHSIIAAHPEVKGNVNPALVEALEALASCAQACTACADACLAEDMVKDLRQCIRLDLDCADICAMTAALATRRTGSNAAILRRALELCVDACRACAAECERHASMHEHCRLCMEACRRCEAACAEAMVHTE